MLVREGEARSERKQALTPDVQEMAGQIEKIEVTLRDPDIIRESESDPCVHLYFHKFEKTPVTRKALLVAVKASTHPFIITAFFTNEQEGSRIVFER